jgi:hypothetical protein
MVQRPLWPEAGFFKVVRVDLLIVLTQFLFRITCGLAGAMALTSPRQVTSGYYRNHLYVALGFMVLATLTISSLQNSSETQHHYSRWPAISAAVISYVGAVCWLYEAKLAGRICLVLVAGLAGYGALETTSVVNHTFEAWQNTTLLLWSLEPWTSSWVLGTVFAAMLLGHWYLNAPGMQLAPLQRLLVIASVVTLLRLILWGVAFYGEYAMRNAIPDGWPFWLLHVLAGLVGTLAMLIMAWQTLKIPNTQSATGILYVGVIFTFLGEVAGMLISTKSFHPL